MQHLEGSGTPVLYIGHTVLKGWFCWTGGGLISCRWSVMFVYKIATSREKWHYRI